MKIRPARASRTIRAAAFTTLAALSVTACGSTGRTATAQTPASRAGTAPAPASTAMPGMSMPAAAASPGPATPTGPLSVTITNFSFRPAKLTVKAGSRVTWTNKDEEPHTVVGGDLKSKVLGNSGATYSHTFSKPGTYNYNCSIHPFMHGTVVVTA
jgi:plastocyanin